jgi:hypothetical protein
VIRERALVAKKRILISEEQRGTSKENAISVS